MATMSVSLPAAMKRSAEQPAQSGRYRSTSDYVRELIRRNQRRQARIDAGLASAPGKRSMDELCEAARKKVTGGD
ncbi:ribbon-helix-helix domain-containing protein [Spiribacter halobius]|uniref:Antitoxin ParD n=1 Tax=Sediminicurvatus halobius TaxID=2182432 RepID=A0A2U2MVU4_9GAMM|nr:type II toxin-antitoxin system ParD family antitoxin [Spiribacter halobius]PWG60978.1 type II toxin-antitoxin system ParD family antitoxin [Spiribacter halobius]UEX77263.1 type II toxin-antitoxin system ParD family antitoxin [Spiribacter halobius]